MDSRDGQKQSLFDDSDEDSDGGVQLNVNEGYAKRFEHNKKREELHRLEEKYKSNKSTSNAGDPDPDSGSSSDETEDENGFLATEELDAQISATLQAIKNKDPRVYDSKTTFYTPAEDKADASDPSSRKPKEKAVYLQDYHREKILRGDTGADEDDEDQQELPQTYAQEQSALKESIRDEIRAQFKARNGEEEASSDGDDDFIKVKEETRVKPGSGVHPSRAEKINIPKPDITDADKDPELFLSNFMASRAWVAEDGPDWQPFESDDEEDDKADEWEAAYNLRFEDPNKSNEVLKSYARDVVAARSVRREEKTSRKRRRDVEREEKEGEKQLRREERARLRRIKLEEAEGKLRKIKKAAGISGKTLKDEEWAKFLEDAWENDKWEEEMNKTFNDQYYAEADEVSDDEDDDDDAASRSKGTKKMKKPKWDDDIDIKDLVPDFEDRDRPNLSLTDNDDDMPSAKRQKTSKERKKEKLQSQKQARQERAKLEALVDTHMNIDDPDILAVSSSKHQDSKGPSSFGYRETKPESFGLTTRDILMATDADLNQFAGLKKLAHFRDPEKQKKDHKRLGKKARLRQWRKETFGPEFEREPPAFNPGSPGPTRSANGPESTGFAAAAVEQSNIVEGSSKKKRKRSRGKKNKSAGGDDAAAAAATPA